KSIQADMCVALNFIDGGNDKGRDFVFSGINAFFGYGDQELSYIFQAKHKSTSQGFKHLQEDLQNELEKVFLTNKLQYDVYCLITNITISGSEYDKLQSIFKKFIVSNPHLEYLRFNIYVIFP